MCHAQPPRGTVCYSMPVRLFILRMKSIYLKNASALCLNGQEIRLIGGRHVLLQALVMQI